MVSKIIILSALLISACGSISPTLKDGQGFYPQPMPELNNKETVSQFSTPASGCFANSQQAVEDEVINPAIKKVIDNRKGIAARNIKVSRSVAPTVVDVLTLGVIWSCSYWDITGDLLQPSQVR